MEKIILYVSASVDQFIASANNEMEWLTDFPFKNRSNYDYDEFYDSVGSVIMGGQTYRDFMCMESFNLDWPFKVKKNYIITHNTFKNNENLIFITDNIADRVNEIKSKEQKDIFLIGGSKIISLFLSMNLIDEMHIHYFPILLGEGKSLFQQSHPQSNWKLKECKSFENGVVKVKYSQW